MSELTIIGIAICIIAFLWTWAACVLARRADDAMDEFERIFFARVTVNKVAHRSFQNFGQMGGPP